MRWQIKSMNACKQTYIHAYIHSFRTSPGVVDTHTHTHSGAHQISTTHIHIHTCARTHCWHQKITTHALTYIGICINMCMCVCIYIYTYIHIYIHTHMHKHIHICTHTHTHTNTYLHAHMYTRTHIYTTDTYTHIHTHTHTHTAGAVYPTITLGHPRQQRPLLRARPRNHTRTQHAPVYIHKRAQSQQHQQ